MLMPSTTAFPSARMLLTFPVAENEPRMLPPPVWRVALTETPVSVVPD
jgi:hypothetical protein